MATTQHTLICLLHKIRLLICKILHIVTRYLYKKNETLNKKLNDQFTTFIEYYKNQNFK
jgi:hypothetical protein